MNKLSIKNEMAMFDGKNREFYDELTIEEKKKFQLFLMLRFGSTVKGSPELQSYYLMATNERLNKHFFELGKHPKLQWLLTTTVSPGLGNQFHEWISTKKKESVNNKAVKFLAEYYPAAKTDELELLARINSKTDLMAFAEAHGLSKQEIKKELG